MQFPKTLKTLITIIFIAVSLFYVAGQAFGADKATPKNSPENIAADGSHAVTVYYFHGKYRCYSCNLIEQLTRISVEEGFSEEIGKGLVSFKVLNVEEQENSHFIKDYSLYTKSVIVSDVRGGKEIRWKNLTKVWELLRNEVAFKSYVQAEVNKFLKNTES